MLHKKFQAFAQVVGFVTIGLLALLGMLSLFNNSSSSALGAVGLAPAAPQAQSTPQTMNYQGTLKDAAGDPLEGTFTMTFRIYDNVTAVVTEAIWSEQHVSVTVRSGHFNVLLGYNEPLSNTLFSEPERYIGVTVDPYDEMAPRQQFANVPYAMYEEIPAGAVMYFNLAACPTGWQELTASQGRYLVGRPNGGTLGATVGTALTDEENRAVGQHNHDVTDPGHSHGVTDPGHSHGVTDPGHTHSIRLDDAVSGAGHIEDTGADERTGMSTGSNTTGISINSNSTSISINAGSTGLTISNSGSTGGTNAPYLQLLVCQKQ
jgi:hypothetical protein